MDETDDMVDTLIFPRNNARADRQKGLDIRVIVGNPPYSVGQKSQNDDNANVRYPTLDASIRDTYAARSATGHSRMHSTTLTFAPSAGPAPGSAKLAEGRPSSATPPNGGWLDGNAASGIRDTLTREFHHVYVYNLRGNQRTSGELSRREGGKVFGSGSRAAVAITLLVKQAGPVPAGGGTIAYHDIGDYLSREEKLAAVAEANVDTLPWQRITPNEHHDWLNQRDAR